MFDNDYDLISQDFKSSINLEFNSYCDCDQYCLKEGVCRSEKIVGLDIQSIDLQKIAETIYKDLDNNDKKSLKRKDKLNFILNGYDHNLDIYCIERILNHFQLYNFENWKFELRNGYYGQEIDSLRIADELRSVIYHNIVSVLDYKTIKEKMELILKLEYGWVLDKLANCNYRITSVLKDQIYFPQQSHLKKVSTKNIYKSRNKKSIMGICRRENQVYSVIDGYNRLSQSPYKKINIIEAYE